MGYQVEATPGKQTINNTYMDPTNQNDNYIEVVRVAPCRGTMYNI